MALRGLFRWLPLFVPSPALVLGAQSARPSALTPAAVSLVEIRRASAPVRIDAVLDEELWRDAQRVPLPFETYPGNNVPARVTTDCRVAYDDVNLYFGCRALDTNPSAIRAVRADRDAVTEQDRVGITIDPFSDRRRAWEFAITPLGVQYDAVYDQQAEHADPSWNAIWTSAGRIVADGYVVEAAIPFKSVRFPLGRREHSWGFMAWRQWPRGADVALRSVPIDPGNRCVLCQAGTLTGLSGIEPGRNVELTPTITGHRSDERAAGATALRAGLPTAELGLDARWSITPDLTLNATANPDFSQVEADVAMLDANLLFALSFPERRPFFLEGADLFSSPQDVVFTRSIADPSAGMKLTGKNGRHAFAVLAARDEVTNLLIPGHVSSAQTMLDGPTLVGLARYRRDLGRSSTLGIVATSRQGDSYSNQVVGVDALIRPRPAWTITAQYLISGTNYPDSVAAAYAQPLGTFGGSLFGTRVGYQTRTTQFGAYAWNFNRQFRADAGFIGQVGMVETGTDVDRWVWAKPGSWFTRMAFGTGFYGSTHDTTPGYTNSWRFVRFTYEGPRQLSYRTYARMRHESFRGVTYDFWTPWMGLTIRPTRTVSLSADGTFGGEIDYAAGRLARTVRISPRMAVRLGRSAEVELRESFFRLTTGDSTLARAALTELRSAYHPTARMFVRAIVQYRTSARTGTPLARSLLSQVLFSYRVDAQTAALFGYGDTRRSDADGPGASDHEDLEPLTRTFFVKLSYAWRP